MSWNYGYFSLNDNLLDSYLITPEIYIHFVIYSRFYVYPGIVKYSGIYLAHFSFIITSLISASIDTFTESLLNRFTFLLFLNKDIQQYTVKHDNTRTTNIFKRKKIFFFVSICQIPFSSNNPWPNKLYQLFHYQNLQPIIYLPVIII